MLVPPMETWIQPTMWKTAEALLCAGLLFFSIIGCASLLRWKSRWMPKKGGTQEESMQETERVYNCEPIRERQRGGHPFPSPPAHESFETGVVERPEVVYENVQYVCQRSEPVDGVRAGCEPDDIYLNESFNIYSNYESRHRYEEDYIFPDEECEQMESTDF